MLSYFNFLTENIGDKILDFWERIKVIIDNDFIFYAIVFVAVVFLILLFRPIKQRQNDEPRKRSKKSIIIPVIIIIIIIAILVYFKFFR